MGKISEALRDIIKESSRKSGNAALNYLSDLVEKYDRDCIRCEEDFR